MITFQGANMVPGLRDVMETIENQFWVGRYENQIWDQGIILASAVDAGNTNGTSNLRSGLLMGKVTASGKLKQWDPTATDGSERIYGVLGPMVSTSFGTSTVDRFVGMILVGGMVDPAKLIVPGTTAMGISGNASEFPIRSQLWPRITLYNDFAGVRNGTWKDVVAKTANYTVTTDDTDTLFTNRGATGAVTFTLPATARKGLRFGFFVVADQNVIVAAGTADTMVCFNDPTADSIAFSTSSEKVGAFIEIIGDGTGWLTLVHLGAESQTPTIAT